MPEELTALLPTNTVPDIIAACICSRPALSALPAEQAGARAEPARRPSLLILPGPSTQPGKASRAAPACPWAPSTAAGAASTGVGVRTPQMDPNSSFCHPCTSPIIPLSITSACTDSEKKIFRIAPIQPFLTYAGFSDVFLTGTASQEERRETDRDPPAAKQRSHSVNLTPTSVTRNRALPAAMLAQAS